MDSRFLSYGAGKILRSRSVFTTPFGKPEGRVRHGDEKEKSPPEVKRPQTGRECNNKGTDCSALDVTVLFQVVHEMLRRVGPHRHPVQFPVPPGEIHHVLPVGAPAVKPAALTQDAYKLGRAGGGNPAAIRQNT